MLEGDGLLFVRFGQQARRFNEPVLDDRLHLRQRQNALTERVERPRRLPFACLSLIVQHAPPLRASRVQSESPDGKPGETGFRHLSPNPLCINHLSTATWGRKPRPLGGVSSTATWGHNPILKNPLGFL